jgi:hypothetical protein
MSGFALSYTANVFILMILYYCFEHLPNTSGRTEERTLSVKPKRKRRRSLLGNSGKHGEDAEKRKFSCLYRESNTDSSVFQSIVIKECWVISLFNTADASTLLETVKGWRGLQWAQAEKTAKNAFGDFVYCPRVYVLSNLDCTRERFGQNQWICMGKENALHLI